ncbi:MAG: hypothetical protein WD598_12445 [Acidimicrobiia bacterium]
MNAKRKRTEKWASRSARDIEPLLPKGPRPRELSVRGLLVGWHLTLGAGAPGHLTRVHATLRQMPVADKRRLGVPDNVTYRHVERLHTEINGPMDPDPIQSPKTKAKRRTPLTAMDAAAREQRLGEVLGRMLRYSVPDTYLAHRAHAIDWTDVESWACPPTSKHGSVDTSASWGHRRANRPTAPSGSARGAHSSTDESFWGYYEQAVTMTQLEHGTAVPELVVAAGLAAPTGGAKHPPALGIKLLRGHLDHGGSAGDLLADSAYPYADDWSLATAELGYDLIVDVNSNLLGKRGVEQGAIVVDDQFLCPATPSALVEIKRPSKTRSDIKRWRAYLDEVDERARYALARHSRPDKQGYQRFRCPAAAGKVRCPLQKASMSLPLNRPKIHQPPTNPPTCCTQATITIGPEVGAKVRQKYPYFGARWQDSYTRRGAVERSFSNIKDRAVIDLERGAIRMIGSTKTRLIRTIAYVVLNHRLLDIFERWIADPSRRRRKPRRSNALLAAAERLGVATNANSPP